jgi:rare lipoprotein A
MTRIFFLVILLAVGGCSSTRPGGYYKDDGPHERPPANLERVADAVPRSEPLHKFANRPYEALGKRYVPLTSVQPFRQSGLASWYGKRYHGQKTSSGETYDMYAMTAAHPTLPIPSYVRVTNLANGKSVVVRVNDRGPFKSERVIDVSYVAAYKLGFIQAGQARVEVEAIVR